MMNDKPEIKNQIECATCPWNKFCIQPPPMTAGDVEQAVRMQGKEDDAPDKQLFSGILAAMVFGGKDIECPACPIFIERLRRDATLSLKIKEIMRNL